MPDELLITQCSPTMAGLKTGNLFTSPIEDKSVFFESLRHFNSMLVPKGARLIPLKYLKKRVLLYMYRPEKLKKDLMDPTALMILKEKKYPYGNSEQCVAELIKRLRADACKAFPHEIGLFLGYPSTDGLLFMRKGPEHAGHNGIWKAYGNIECAKKTCAQYKKCCRCYKEAYAKRGSFDKLVIANRRFA